MLDTPHGQVYNHACNRIVCFSFMTAHVVPAVPTVDYVGQVRNEAE